MKPHTSHIAAALLIAWIIFIISRQELPIYMGILGVGKYNITPAQCGGSVIGSLAGTASTQLPNFPGTVSVGLSPGPTTGQIAIPL